MKQQVANLFLCKSPVVANIGVYDEKRPTAPKSAEIHW